MPTIIRNYGDPILFKTDQGVVEIRVYKNQAKRGPGSGKPLVVSVQASKEIPICRHGIDEGADYGR